MQVLGLADNYALDRGDVDDRVLLEAMLPLLETLALATDVRPILHTRFDMQRWFASQVSHMLPSQCSCWFDLLDTSFQSCLYACRLKLKQA